MNGMPKAVLLRRRSEEQRWRHACVLSSPAAGNIPAVFENVELITRRFCASITDIPCPVRTSAELRWREPPGRAERRVRRTVVAVTDHVANEGVLAGAVGVFRARARRRRGRVLGAGVAVAGPHRDAVSACVLDA